MLWCTEKEWEWELLRGEKRGKKRKVGNFVLRVMFREDLPEVLPVLALCVVMVMVVFIIKRRGDAM